YVNVQFPQAFGAGVYWKTPLPRGASEPHVGGLTITMLQLNVPPQALALSTSEASAHRSRLIGVSSGVTNVIGAQTGGSFTGVTSTVTRQSLDCRPFVSTAR